MINYNRHQHLTYQVFDGTPKSILSLCQVGDNLLFENRNDKHQLELQIEGSHAINLDTGHPISTNELQTTFDYVTPKYSQQSYTIGQILIRQIKYHRSATNDGYRTGMTQFYTMSPQHLIQKYPYNL